MFVCVLLGLVFYLDSGDSDHFVIVGRVWYYHRLVLWDYHALFSK